MDKTDKVKKMLSRGDPKLNLKQYKEGSFKTNEEKLEEIVDAFNIVAMGSDHCKVKELAEYLTGSDGKVETKRRYIYQVLQDCESDFVLKNGVISKVKKEGKK